MYSQFFGLHKNPFSQLVRQSNIFFPKSHQQIFNQLVETIEKSVGVICFVGSTGVGKSTLISRIVEVLFQDNQAFAFKDLSVFINTEAWSEVPQYNFSEVIKAVRDDAAENGGDCQKVVYLLDVEEGIDEAPLAELLKIVAERNAQSSPTVLILVGCSSLMHSFNVAQYALGAQSSEGIIDLDALSEAEVKSYVEHRLSVARYSGPAIFTEDAIGAIALLSNGLPRNINTICGMALFQADKQQLSIVTEKEVRQAGENCLLEIEADSPPFVEKQLFEDSFIKVPEREIKQQFGVQKSIITCTNNGHVTETEECSTYEPQQDEVRRRDVHGAVMTPVSEQVFEHSEHKPKHRHLLRDLGTLALVLMVLIVITDRWYLVQQTVSSIEKNDVASPSDQLQPTAMFQENPFTDIEQEEPDLEIDEQYTAFSIVNSDSTDSSWDSPSMLPSDNSIEEIEDLLDQAGILEHKHQLTLPKDNNAIAVYRRILDLQPENSAAIEGIERIKQQFVQQAKRAIAQSQWKVAQSYVKKARYIDSNNRMIDALSADVEANITQTRVAGQDSGMDLHELAARDRARARYRLAERGVDFNLSDFFVHAEQGNSSLVALFLDAGIPVDAQDTHSGDTALIKALTFGHLDTARLILNQQANVDIQNRKGRTAVMSAIVFERYSIVFDILKRTANVNLSDQSGWNALMLAVQKNQPTIVDVLLKKGADIQAKNILGQSALSIAEENSHKAIISLLQSNR